MQNTIVGTAAWEFYLLAIALEAVELHFRRKNNDRRLTDRMMEIHRRAMS